MRVTASRRDGLLLLRTLTGSQTESREVLGF
jgi:hypothetical protein